MKTLTSFIKESNNDIKHIRTEETGGLFIIDNIGSLNYLDNVITYPTSTENAFEITNLEVNNKNQRAGIGSKLMNAFMEYAKSQNKDVVVYASPLDDNMSEADLIKFYNKFGFVHDDRTKDNKCLIYKN